jgi:hypothetical protein
MATNGSFAQQEQYKNTNEQYPATSVAADSGSGSASGNDLSKDEVGWYFVEQYYTTLSKSPEKLHVSYVALKLQSARLMTDIALLRKAFPIRLWP